MLLERFMDILTVKTILTLAAKNVFQGSLKYL